MITKKTLEYYQRKNAGCLERLERRYLREWKRRLELVNEKTRELYLIREVLNER